MSSLRFFLLNLQHHHDKLSLDPTIISAPSSGAANQLVIYTHELGDITPPSEHLDTTGHTPQGVSVKKLGGFIFLATLYSVFAIELCMIPEDIELPST